MSIVINHKLGNTIGFYGDSFADFPMKSSGSSKYCQKNPYSDNKDVTSDYNDPWWINYNYKIDKLKILNTAEYNLFDLWTNKLISDFTSPIVYNKGYCGSNIWHLINIQLGLDNTLFQKPIEIPDVMIIVWTEPTRLYFDPIETITDFDFLNLEVVDFLNRIGVPDEEKRHGLFNANSTDKNLFLKQKMWAHVKRLASVTSKKLVLKQQLQTKLFFDKEYYYELKERNKNVKIINIDCFPYYDITKINHSDFKNCVWISNFDLISYSNYKAPRDARFIEDSFDKNCLLHIRTQKHHDFLYDKLKQLIYNYSPGVHNWKNWKKDFNTFQ